MALLLVAAVLEKFGAYLSYNPEWQTLPPIRESLVFQEMQKTDSHTLTLHMGPEDPSNRKKYPSFFSKSNCRILQNISKNVSLKIGSRLPQKLKLFLCFYIIKSVARKGQNTPKSDLKYPQMCELNIKHVVLYVGQLYSLFWTKKF